MSTPIHRIIVGTAGHIDHGKSTLVRVLTGIDPDRLKEEKARGMTIDLGFAPYLTASGRQVGMIDVPGHERFVKNMVAGASSVDLFLLVVAADDGVMPQTREHVEILDLLGARQGIVVITKIDLVEPGMRELAIADIETFLRGSPFERAAKIAVSAETGEGLPELRKALDGLIDATPPREREGVFRMPIQRVFSARGQGTVVTGVPASGSVALGDVVEVLPLGAKGKVRGLQAYREDRDAAAAGHSTAINLTDVDYRTVRRGMVAAAPGYFRPATRIEARLRHLASAERPLKHGTDVRLHVGTAEVLARLVLLEEGTSIQPGEEALVQFRLREAAVVAPGDRFLIRLATPMLTLGGGVIVAASGSGTSLSRARAAESTERKEAVLEDRIAYFLELLAERGARPTPLLEAPALFALPKAVADRELALLVESGAVRLVGRDKIVAGKAFDAIGVKLLDELRSFHAANPLAAADEALRLRTALRLDEAVYDALVQHLSKTGKIALEKGGRVRLEGAGPRLSGEQQERLERIRQALEAGGFAPPAPGELATKLSLAEPALAALVKLLVDRGEAWKAGEFVFASSAIDRAKDAIRAVAAPSGEIEIPKLRDRLATTRKYLIPLLESLDAKGFTVRRGDKRFLAKRGSP